MIKSPFTEGYTFGNVELLDIYIKNNRAEVAVKQHILKKIGESLNESKVAQINKKVRAFVKYFEKHWPHCHRVMSRFRKKHSEWLDKSLVINTEINRVSENKVGRPKVDYENASSRLKRKFAKELSQEHENSLPLLLHAATVSAKKSEEKDMVAVLKAAAKSKDICKMKRKLFSSEPQQMSADSALAFLLENGFTKEQYNNIKQNAKIHGYDIYPPYKDLSSSKLKLRPDGIQYFEDKAQVPLQQLLDHTTTRILEMQHEVLGILLNVTHCKLIFSYGYDGSTGHSMYKQRFQDHGNVSDYSLFVTTIIPLKLINETDQIIWVNKAPHSVRFCRPLKIEFIKESHALILTEKEYLDTEIRNLKSYMYGYNGKKIFVEYLGQMTLIDGKVLNILSGCNSCQSCPICGAKPTQLLNIKDINSEVF